MYQFYLLKKAIQSSKSRPVFLPVWVTPPVLHPHCALTYAGSRITLGIWYRFGKQETRIRGDWFFFFFSVSTSQLLNKINLFGGTSAFQRQRKLSVVSNRRNKHGLCRLIQAFPESEDMMWRTTDKYRYRISRLQRVLKPIRIVDT